MTLAQSSWIPGHITRYSYSTLDPSSSSTERASGSTETAPLRIHVTPWGMTEACGRALCSTGARPPPTSVHSGW
ncbi:hypothetical protein WY02_17660 [Pseudonocardia sp. AL041005-10]|nr:hypothetical protein WY02_17660 [Pseudonocardia sp. AL041005-10]